METETIIKIRGYHIDHFGHVNHARYIEFLEEARWAYMETNNLITLFHQTGIIHVVAGISVKYKRSARAGDVIKINTRLEKPEPVGFAMGQDIFLGNILILEARVDNVFIDINHQKTIAPSTALISGWSDLCNRYKKEETKNG